MADHRSGFPHGDIIGGWRTMLPLSVATLLIGLSVVLLRNDLDRLPKVPSQKDGRTWHLEDHGQVAYGTFEETVPVYGSLIAGLVIGALGLGNEKRIRAQSDIKDA